MSSWEAPEWVDEVDPASGAVYYVNSLTGETTWERPQTPSVRVVPELPDGWIELMDPSSRAYYYVETATGAALWAPPSRRYLFLRSHLHEWRDVIMRQKAAAAEALRRVAVARVTKSQARAC